MSNPIDAVFFKSWAENGRSDSIAENAVGFAKWLINGCPKDDTPGPTNPGSAKKAIQDRPSQIDKAVGQ